MRKRIITKSVLGLVIISGLSSCGSRGNKTSNSSVATINVESISSTNSASENSSSSEEELSFDEYIIKARKKLEDNALALINQVQNEIIKQSIRSFYDSELKYVNDIHEYSVAKNAPAQVLIDIKSFAIYTLKPLAINEANEEINPLINNINDEQIKSSVKAYYESKIKEFGTVSYIEDVIKIYKSTVKETKDYITTEKNKKLITLKNNANDELDSYLNELIKKIPYEANKIDTKAFYKTEKQKIEKIDNLEDVSTCVLEIKNNLEAFALKETKKTAISKLQEMIDEGNNQIISLETKKELEDYSKLEIEKINAISGIEDLSNIVDEVIQETRTYIDATLKQEIKSFFKELTEIERINAYNYLPSAMSPNYLNNIVSESSINYNFESNTSISSISKVGYGDQWQMVAENINQCISIQNVFSVSQTLIKAAENAVDIYLTNSFSSEISYPFTGSGYEALFNYKDSKIALEIKIMSEVTIPNVGSGKPIIKMEYDLKKGTRIMFISIGEVNKIKYLVSNNSFEMAMQYETIEGGKSISRTSYLSIANDSINNTTSGNIYEYSTYEGNNQIKACADFYVENGYLSIIGNKNYGNISHDGYVNELYLANQGRLLGFEESLIISTESEMINRLWFNLWNISGISSVKVTEKSKGNSSKNSLNDTYLNGTSSLLVPPYNIELGEQTTRKYDVELRNRFYYCLDNNNDYSSMQTKIPMMFIQEGDNFDSFASDAKTENDLTLGVSLNSIYLEKIKSDNKSLKDKYNKNKDLVSLESILTYFK